MSVISRYVSLIDRFTGPENVPSLWRAFWNIKFLVVVHFLVLMSPLLIFEWNSPLNSTEFAYIVAIFITLLAFICFAYARRSLRWSSMLQNGATND